ncbi:MAG: cytochrome c biogenesis protein CcsA, partial [Planctomycetes bacterium]|nr:cytochrome c biogenesis protein CcsA [Planctomycetota bacterium]
LPLVEQGRVKPFDTLARNSLRIISNRQTFEDDKGKTQPAIRWLLDVIARPGVAEKHRVFRIENPEVLETLGLERREGLRYSVSELLPKVDEYNRQVDQAHKVEKKDPKDLTLYQRKILELDRRARTYTLLKASFRAQPFPLFPTEEELKKDRENVMKRLVRIKELLEEAEWLDERLTSMHAPLSVPAEGTKDEQAQNTWQAYATAVSHAYRGTIRGEDPNPATVALTAIFDAYATGDAVTFNSEVARYQGSLAANPPVTESASVATLNLPKARFEAFFNHFEPFFHASMLYLIGFIVACLAWLGWFRPLNRISSYLIALALVVHTFALISRIYISGRPPVTNLYSAAVFIGFGAVALGLVLEAVYRLGIGNVVAGVAGFMTLLIAHILAADGDTFTVLQAVLDTQFWLATHVVCITLGYATTFLAGLLGVLYVVVGVLTPSLSPNLAKASARMIYGILCFAIFFSFVGTVLGGLWADDSWGRFWGWDPKENGALIIVLWNALILHARWDGMVKDRGLALLAIAGNITTGWSMFGVNELGVGLHSYGFTEGVLRALGLFVLSQLALIALGSMPRERWWSFRRHSSNLAEV